MHWKSNTQSCESTLTLKFVSLPILQEAALHAPLPPGLRGPMAGHQQKVSNLSSWHRNTAEPRQLMRFDTLVIQSPSWCDSCFLPPPARQPPPPYPTPPHPTSLDLLLPVGCFAKCLQTSCDITTLLSHALLSQARKTNCTERPQRTLFI